MTYRWPQIDVASPAPDGLRRRLIRVLSEDQIEGICILAEFLNEELGESLPVEPYEGPYFGFYLLLTPEVVRTLCQLGIVGGGGEVE